VEGWGEGGYQVWAGISPPTGIETCSCHGGGEGINKKKGRTLSELGKTCFNNRDHPNLSSS